MAEVNPLENTVCGAMDLKFKEEVERLSGGQIKIDLQGGGVLGVEADILDGMLGGTGTVDICRISAFALTSYGTKKSVLLSLPYTFADRNHYWNFANSELGQEFLNESEELGLGVKGLYFGEEGFRHFFTVESKPISSPADMKNMKIRVSNDPIMTKMVQSLGATPSPVSMSEIYSSMQNGTIDGAEQPTVNYAGNRFQEVGPNLTLDGHTLGAMMTIITDEAWNSLTEEQQGWIMEAAKYASSVCREKVAEIEGETFDKLAAAGATVIPVEDKSPWVEACQPTIKANTEKLADLYQQILDMAK
jgi:tripartite ATP-independent transporter DctP family solute receptor